MKIQEISNLVYEFGDGIYSFCLQLARNKEEADELYQETFLKAIEVCEKIDADGNPKSFLLSMAARLWKNRKRKYAWRNRIAGIVSYQDEIEYLEQSSGEDSAEDKFLEKETSRILKEAVAELDEKYRLPMYLYYSHYLSLEEIGEVLKIPKGTVKSRLFKARMKVKEILEVNGYER